MDLLYMPEMMSFESHRTYSHYTDYTTPPWNRNFYNNNYGMSNYEQRCQRIQETKSSSKNCDLCKESKRRGLAKFIKQRSTHAKQVCSRICEEEEPEETPNNNDEKNST